MNSNSREIKLHNFLQQWIDFIISRTIKPENTGKATSFSMCYKHKCDMRLAYVLIVCFL